jgi:hypothetical protein
MMINVPDDQEICLRGFVFVDWSSVQIVLEGLNRLAWQHLTQEGARVSKCEFSEFVTKGRIVGSRFSLVIIFNL